MRKSREDELLWFLSSSPEGMTIKEIVGEHEILEKTISQQHGSRKRWFWGSCIVWSKGTVFRHLKNLIAAGKVKKHDPIKKGCRGKPGSRYQVNPDQKFYIPWFPPGLRYQRCGSPVLRQSDEQKQIFNFNEYKQYFKSKPHFKK
jgi:hypothetical protein